MSVSDGALGEGGRGRALAHAGRAGDADANGALQARNETVPDFGNESGFVFDLGNQAGAGQALAGEEALPESGIDGKTRACIGIHVLSL
jgi:hypothetical protein